MDTNQRGITEQTFQCAIDSIGDAIENRRLHRLAHDKGLDWALEILQILGVGVKAQEKP